MDVEPWVPITAVVAGFGLAIVIWRSAWVVLIAMAGALLGALVFMGSGGEIVDGYPDCAACGSYTLLRIGGKVRSEHYEAVVVLGAAIGAFFAVGACGLSRRTRRTVDLRTNS